LLSFRGISTPSLPAQGEQRRSSYFNIPRGNSGLGERPRQMRARDDQPVSISSVWLKCKQTGLVVVGSFEFVGHLSFRRLVPKYSTANNIAMTAAAITAGVLIS
jgi:hypothetical protein